jgi:hypothetical protein
LRRQKPKPKKPQLPSVVTDGAKALAAFQHLRPKLKQAAEAARKPAGRR